jgi:hypothetical protein
LKNINLFLKQTKYERPYNSREVKEIYGMDIYNKLSRDPVHKWRMKTGIELIHKEPTYDEQLRIFKNWQLMTNEQKRVSDEKSFELFGMSNIDHHYKLMREWKRIIQDYDV